MGMSIKKSLKVASISALRVGFSTALATAISIGTTAALSFYSSSTEHRLGEILKNMHPIGIVLNWGVIPGSCAFIFTGILEFLMYLKLRSPLQQPLSLEHQLRQFFAHNRKINQVEIHLTSIFSILNASLNLYALGAGELEFGVGVPLASVVGMIFSTHGIPLKAAKFMVNTGHSFLRHCCCFRPKSPAPIVINNPLALASSRNIHRETKPGVEMSNC